MKNKIFTKSNKCFLGKKAKSLLILIALFASTQIIAQVPEKINYQVVVRDATGVPKANTNVQLKFILTDGNNATYNQPSSGYTTLMTNSYGMLNIENRSNYWN